MTPPVEINNQNPCVASVIWLHGLGADGHDFATVCQMLNLPKVHFVLPHAPIRSVTINNGAEMRAWYDVFSFAPNSREDEAGIRASQKIVESLIAQEIDRGIKPNHIVIAGFSQGGAIALQTALRYPQKLAGVMALSTYLPLKASLTAEASIANQQIPIWMGHGGFDPVIALSSNQLSRDVLSQHHYAVDFHQYPMAHAVNNDEIADIRDFLIKVLNLSAD